MSCVHFIPAQGRSRGRVPLFLIQEHPRLPGFPSDVYGIMTQRSDSARPRPYAELYQVLHTLGGLCTLANYNTVITNYRHTGITNYTHTVITNYTHTGITNYTHTGITNYTHTGITNYTHTGITNYTYTGITNYTHTGITNYTHTGITNYTHTGITNYTHTGITTIDTYIVSIRSTLPSYALQSSVILLIAFLVFDPTNFPDT